MKHRRGFTLVELNLAMIFVAILLISVALLTIQVTRMYQKGVTIKTVNQVGREVTDQLRTDITEATDISSWVQGTGSGRICLGAVSYVYNTPTALDSANYLEKADGQPIYLARIIDPNAAWCEDGSGTSPVLTQLSAGDEFTELLINDDTSPLAVHQMALESYSPTGTSVISQRLQHLSMQIGTNEADTIDGGQCRPPTASEANFDYCFVAEFETIIRSGEERRE